MDPVREYLNSVLESRLEVRRLRRKIASLEARATGITSQLSGMPRGGGSDRDAVLAALADASSEYGRMLAEAERHELEVLRFIDSLSPDARLILKLRYVDGRRWSSVLTALCESGREMSKRKMYRLHGEALREAREKYRTKGNVS